MSKQPDNTSFTARTLLSRGQLGALLTIALYGVIDVLLFGLNHLTTTVAGLWVMCYTAVALGRVATWWADNRLPTHEPAQPHAESLPTYTVLVPLYREVTVVDGLLRALRELRYPTDRLQVLLLLEADDSQMISTVRSAVLPCHFVALMVPRVGPRTTPKACNFAMPVATGEYVVIFEARDRPEPDHLLKAVTGMRSEQARRGTWRLKSIPTLSRTRDHFHAPALWAVAEEYGYEIFTHGAEQLCVPNIWDSYNVTADADLAARLARLGYHTGVHTAGTPVEAPNRLSTVLRQQTRWLQGRLITGLVHIRRPLHSIRGMGPIRYLHFGLGMLATPVALALNPLVWAAAITHLIAWAGNQTTALGWFEKLLPPTLWYISVSVVVVGNLLLAAQILLAAMGARQDDRTNLTKEIRTASLWWAVTSLSAYRALWRLHAPRTCWETDLNESEEARAQCAVKTSPLTR